MTQPQTYTVTGSARIEANPARVYGIIADYHHGHPSIVPKQFRNMRVEAGGVGAGTTIAFEVTVLGKTQRFRAVVSEPQPGRVLVEHNVQPDDSITTFTVAPENGGRAASVTIETQMPLRPGLAGQIERLVTMWVMRSMYVVELKKLAEVAAR